MPRQQTLEPLTLMQNDISTLAYSLFLFRSFSCVSLSTATYSQSSFLFPLPLLIILFRSLIPPLSLWSLSTHTTWEIITNLTNHNHHHHIFRPHCNALPKSTKTHQVIKTKLNSPKTPTQWPCHSKTTFQGLFCFRSRLFGLSFFVQDPNVF